MTAPIITAVFAILYFVVTLWMVRRVKLNAQTICYAGVICALTVVLAGIRVPLPTGSNITCGSWIPLMILALVVDVRLAMLAGWVCGILVMFLLPGWEAVHWAQIFVQQLVCASPASAMPVFSAGKRSGRYCAAPHLRF